MLIWRRWDTERSGPGRINSNGTACVRSRLRHLFGYRKSSLRAGKEKEFCLLRQCGLPQSKIAGVGVGPISGSCYNKSFSDRAGSSRYLLFGFAMMRKHLYKSFRGSTGGRDTISLPGGSDSTESFRDGVSTLPEGSGGGSDGSFGGGCCISPTGEQALDLKSVGTNGGMQMYSLSFRSLSKTPNSSILSVILSIFSSRTITFRWRSTSATLLFLPVELLPEGSVLGPHSAAVNPSFSQVIHASE